MNHYIYPAIALLCSTLTSCSESDITAEQALQKALSMASKVGRASLPSQIHVARLGDSYRVALQGNNEYTLVVFVRAANGDVASLYDEQLVFAKEDKKWKPQAIRIGTESAARPILDALVQRLKGSNSVSFIYIRIIAPVYAGGSPTFSAKYEKKVDGFPFVEDFVGVRLWIDGANGDVERLTQNFRHAPCHKQGEPMSVAAIKAKWKQIHPRGNLDDLKELRLGWGKLRQGSNLGLVYKFHFEAMQPRAYVKYEYLDAVTGEQIRLEI